MTLLQNDFFFSSTVSIHWKMNLGHRLFRVCVQTELQSLSPVSWKPLRTYCYPFVVHLDILLDIPLVWKLGFHRLCHLPAAISWVPMHSGSIIRCSLPGPSYKFSLKASATSSFLGWWISSHLSNESPYGPLFSPVGDTLEFLLLLLY